MKKPFIVKAGGRKVYARYSRRRIKINISAQRQLEEKNVEFLFHKYTASQEAVLISRVKLFELYADKNYINIRFEEAKECEADAADKKSLEHFCAIARRHDTQESFKDDKKHLEKSGEYYILKTDSAPEMASGPDIDDVLANPIKDDKAATEGERRLRVHCRIERNSRLRDRKIADAKKIADGVLSCEICGIKENSLYPALFGRRIFEVHHKTPLSEAQGAAETKLEDLAVLCACCHRAVHKDSNVQGNFDELTRHFKK